MTRPSCLSSVGPLRIEFQDPVSLEQIKSENPNVQHGGRFKPKDCLALQKVAIIIPFRNRDEHLKYWLYYLHPILQRQQLDYGVYVINQVRCRLLLGLFSQPQSARETLRGTTSSVAVPLKHVLLHVMPPIPLNVTLLTQTNTHTLHR